MRSRHHAVSRGITVLAGSLALAVVWAPMVSSGASPSPIASAAPSAGPTVVTETAPTVAWGPLAMVRDPLRDQLDAGMEPGILRINPSCVVIEGETFATTLVFRDWQVIWRPSDETIVVADNAGELSVLADGDTVSLGGYAAWVEDTTGQPAAPPWLVQPGPDCPTDLFLVHSARAAD
jgi:hypothetical protein